MQVCCAAGLVMVSIGCLLYVDVVVVAEYGSVFECCCVECEWDYEASAVPDSSEFYVFYLYHAVVLSLTIYKFYDSLTYVSKTARIAFYATFIPLPTQYQSFKRKPRGDPTGFGETRKRREGAYAVG